MGEAKRKRDTLSPVERKAVEETHRLANEGKLIEGGFAAWCIINKIAPDHPALPVLHDAYWSAAEHLWSSIMVTLDQGREPTDRDMRRMDLIFNEIKAWRNQKQNAYAKSMPTEGRA